MSRDNEPLPWTKFSYDDFLDDPVVVAMPDEAIRPYLRLLRAAWRSTTPGHLPNDDCYLAGASGLAERWPEYRQAILRGFKLKRDMLIQSRIVREYEACRREHDRLSAQAVRANEVRWRGDRAAIRRGSLDRDRDKSKSTESKEAPETFRGVVACNPPHRLSEPRARRNGGQDGGAGRKSAKGGEA